MNKIIAFFGGEKLAAVFSKVQGFLRGKRTYALGTLAILQGAVGLASSVAGLPAPSDLVAFVRALGDNPDWNMILAGAAMFTIRAAIPEKAKSGDGKTA